MEQPRLCLAHAETFDFLVTPKHESISKVGQLRIVEHFLLGQGSFVLIRAPAPSPRLIVGQARIPICHPDYRDLGTTSP